METYMVFIKGVLPRFGLCGSLTGAVGYFQSEKRKKV